jgi:hypothetical protein
MKLVKALALLLVPLLLSSFLTVMPVAHADKPMPFSMALTWVVSTSVEVDTLTGPIDHFTFTAHFDFYTNDAASCYLGYTEPVWQGHWNADFSGYEWKSIGATFYIQNSCPTFLGGKTGTIIVNLQKGVPGDEHWEFVGGTGGLAGIRGQGTVTWLGNSPDYAYYYYVDAGTVHFTK